jgi:hypothetical protein
MIGCIAGLSIRFLTVTVVSEPALGKAAKFAVNRVLPILEKNGCRAKTVQSLGKCPS